MWSCVAAWAVSSSHPAQVHWAPGSCPALLFLLMVCRWCDTGGVASMQAATLPALYSPQPDNHIVVVTDHALSVIGFGVAQPAV